MKRFPKVGKHPFREGREPLPETPAEMALESRGNTRETPGNVPKVYRETFSLSRRETFPDPPRMESKDAPRGKDTNPCLSRSR